VAANDRDPEGAPLTATVVSGPTHGSLTFAADGSFIYTPVAGYTGADSFTYVVGDGTGVSNLATVVITVKPAGGPVVQPPSGGTPPETEPPPETEEPPETEPPSAEADTVPALDEGGFVGASSRSAGEMKSHRQRLGPTALPSVAALEKSAGDLQLFDQSDSLTSVAIRATETVDRIARQLLPQDVLEAVERFVAPFDISLLSNDLSNMEREMGGNQHFTLVAAGSAGIVSTAFTVGYVLWTIRGGWLAASLLAQMPAWRLVDPLVVLDYLGDEPLAGARKDEDDSLESMLSPTNGDQQAKHPPTQRLEDLNSESIHETVDG
jgi:hypothetical protein